MQEHADKLEKLIKTLPKKTYANLYFIGFCEYKDLELDSNQYFLSKPWVLITWTWKIWKFTWKITKTMDLWHARAYTRRACPIPRGYITRTSPTRIFEYFVFFVLLFIRSYFFLLLCSSMSLSSLRIHHPPLLWGSSARALGLHKTILHHTWIDHKLLPCFEEACHELLQHMYSSENT